MVTQCYSNPYILQEWLFTQPHISIVEGLWSDPLVNKRGRGSFTYLWKLYILCWYIYICILYMYVYIYIYIYVTYTGAVDIYLSIDIELYTYYIYIYYIYILYIYIIYTRTEPDVCPEPTPVTHKMMFFFNGPSSGQSARRVAAESLISKPGSQGPVVFYIMHPLVICYIAMV